MGFIIDYIYLKPENTALSILGIFYIFDMTKIKNANIPGKEVRILLQCKFIVRLNSKNVLKPKSKTV